MSRLKLINDPWYSEGLAFDCTGCGACCTGEPGYVWVTPEEIQEIANFLSLSLDDFVQKYVRSAEGRFSLKEKVPDYDCVFLEDKKCQIYPVRPRQCRTFPFWPRCLESKEAWDKTALACEGIREGKTIWTKETIERVKL